MAKNGGVSDDDLKLAGLSEAEREALNEDESGENAATLAAVAGEGDGEAEGEGDGAAQGDGEGDDNGEAGAGEGDGAEAAAGDEAGKVTAAADASSAAGDAAEQSTEQEEEIAAQSMRMAVPDVADVDAKRGEINERLSEAQRAFKAGDLEWEDFHEQEQTLYSERRGLDIRQAQHDQAVSYNEAADQHDWQQTVSAFIRRTAKDEKIDYSPGAKIKVDGREVSLVDEWDKCVKFLAADTANADKSATWFLREAHAMVKARYRLGDGGAAPQRLGADGKPNKNGRQPASRKGVPATLADAPLAQESDVNGQDEGEFAALDKLSGLDYEAALARLTPAQQQRYAEAV